MSTAAPLHVAVLVIELGLFGQPHARARATRQYPFLRYPNLVKDLEISQPNQVWASDITYHKQSTYPILLRDTIIALQELGIVVWGWGYLYGGFLLQAKAEAAAAAAFARSVFLIERISRKIHRASTRTGTKVFTACLYTSWTPVKELFG